ncbi:hypothetical protein HZS_7870 [Henneguya salminicola]|nr:hypothetical protein HZS_7870 [Henneguya salminicola]
MYFLGTGVEENFTFLEKTIFYTNTGNFRFWNIMSFPITLLHHAAALFIFLIRRERQKTAQIKELFNY